MSGVYLSVIKIVLKIYKYNGTLVDDQIMTERSFL